MSIVIKLENISKKCRPDNVGMKVISQDLKCWWQIIMAKRNLD